MVKYSGVAKSEEPITQNPTVYSLLIWLQALSEEPLATRWHRELRGPALGRLCAPTRHGDLEPTPL